MTIESRIGEGVLSITINRPEVLNALDIPHLEALIEEINQAGRDNSVGCILIGGVDRALSVGADIKAMDSMTDEEFAQAAEMYQEMCRVTRGLDKPIIAAINGYALGGGLEVALMADIRIAAKSAKLGLPDAELGFSPTGGMTYLLNKIVGTGWAMHLAMTAEILDSEKALELGLVTLVVDDGELVHTATELAQRIAAYPPVGMKNIKRSFTAAAEQSLESILELEAKFDSECYQSEETRTALNKFVQSRKK